MLTESEISAVPGLESLEWVEMWLNNMQEDNPVRPHFVRLHGDLTRLRREVSLAREATTVRPAPSDPRLADITIRFKAANVPLMSLNDRRHHQARARMARDWRRLACVAGARARGLNGLRADAYAYLLIDADVVRAQALRRYGLEVITDTRWSVQVDLPVSSTRPRDPHNFVATVKPIVDGLTDAGFWPDDTARYVTVAEPTLTKTDHVTVTLTKIGAPL